MQEGSYRKKNFLFQYYNHIFVTLKQMPFASGGRIRAYGPFDATHGIMVAIPTFEITNFKHIQSENNNIYSDRNFILYIK